MPGIGKRQMIMRGGGAAPGGGTPPPSPTNALLIFFNGESNAVGYGFNSEAPAGELGSHPAIQILNNSSLVYQNLNIGVNNDFEVAGSHGWELELAKIVEASGIGQYNTVYLCKTAKAGTRISDWAVGGTWETRMRTRMTAAINNLTNIGLTPKIVCWYSQGLNDISGTPGGTWRTDTIAHFANLRSLYGSTLPIIMTKFFNQYTAYDTEMDTIDAADPYVTAVAGSGTAQNADGIHWSYAGLKTMADRLISATIPYL